MKDGMCILHFKQLEPKYASGVLMIFFTGTEYPQGYCISSRVLHVLMGTEGSLYRVSVDRVNFVNIL